MNHDRTKARVLVSLPPALVTQIRIQAVAHDTNVSVLARAMLRYSLRDPQDPGLLAAIAEEVAEDKKRRSATGKAAMRSRYAQGPEETR